MVESMAHPFSCDKNKLCFEQQPRAVVGDRLLSCGAFTHHVRSGFVSWPEIDERTCGGLVMTTLT